MLIGWLLESFDHDAEFLSHAGRRRYDAEQGALRRSRMTEKLQAEFDRLSQLPAVEQDRFAELIRDLQLQELRKAIREGIESGEPVPFDAEDIIRRGRERLAARKKRSA